MEAFALHEITGESSWIGRSGITGVFLFFHGQKKSVRVRRRGSRVASDSTVEIAGADRATYYLRYRDDLCLPTARFSNFVPLACLFRDKGRREKVHCHVRVYASCSEKNAATARRKLNG